MVRAHWHSLARASMLLLLLTHLGLRFDLGDPAFGQSSGRMSPIKIVVPPSPPPVGFTPPMRRMTATSGDVMLSDVPAYSWCYGCSPTAAGMLAGYFTQHGFPNLYTGPTGYIPPFNDPVWGAGECPFIASHQGIDGRTTRGYVDDYWGEPDPCVEHSWVPHIDDSLCDFMETGEERNGLADGTTYFYAYPDGRPLYDFLPSSGRDGCHGMRLFFEARGYTVATNYTQAIYHAITAPGGFTYAQYCAEIDNGYPVVLQLDGHTMLGVGYNKTQQLTYVHTTWGNYVFPFVWGGTFFGLTQWGVTIIHPQLPTPAGVTASKGTCYPGVYVTWKPVPAGSAGKLYYRVSRGTTASGSDRTPISGWLTGTAYGDSAANLGQQYWYWVTAASNTTAGQESAFGTPDTGWRATQPIPNSPPTLGPIPSISIAENSGAHALTLTGITPGAPADLFQQVSITAVSSKPALLPSPRVSYANPDTQGMLVVTPVTGAFGSALVTVTVKDNGGTANGGKDTTIKTFLVVVNYRNDPPTIRQLPPQVVNENGGTVKLTLTGISPGDADDIRQRVTLTAVSGNPALIPNPTVTYTNPNTTGSLTFTPVANAYGNTLITVIAKDDGGTANNGHDTTTMSFRVTVRPLGTVVCWGAGATKLRKDPHYGQSLTPAGLNGIVALASGGYHTVALRSDGTVICWGDNAFGECTAPAGLTGVIAVAAGVYHTVALKQDGTVVCWGAGLTDTGSSPHFGQSHVPVGVSGVVAIAAGFHHTVAVKQDGTVVCWGAGTTATGVWPQFGQSLPPAGLAGVIAVAAGGTHSTALKADGTVVCWGSDSFGQCEVPVDLTGVAAITAGIYHTAALTRDGTVVCWGNDWYHQTDTPANLSGVVTLSAGWWHTAAVTADGKVVSWGAGTANTGSDPNYGQAIIPTGLTGVSLVVGGGYHTAALTVAKPSTVSQALPDLMIRNPADTTYAGVGVFNTDGTNQTKQQTVAGGTTATYLMHLQNDGYITDNFTVTTSAIPSGWSWAYYDASGTNITAAITGNTGWPVSNLSPGAIKLFYMQLVPGKTVTAGATVTITITATAAGNPTRKDVVKAVATRR